MASEPLLVKADRVVYRDAIIYHGAVRVADGKIEAVDEAQRFEPRPQEQSLEGALLLPGFIDLHTHGYGGHAFSGGPDDVREACRLAVRAGVTTLFAGVGDGPSLESIAASLAGVGHLVGKDTRGARLAGSFLEGPFMSEAKRGAWNVAHLRAPSIDELELLKDAAGGTLRRVNVAPELPGAIDFIRAARRADIVVSIGHSNATYEQAMAAVAAGASIANHTFNAMSGLDHRQPGLVGAALGCRNLLAELILDGVHVHPAAAQALYEARSASGVALVSDSAAVAGLPDGVYDVGDRRVTIREGACRLPDETLAGSVAALDTAVRNARSWLTDDALALAAMSSGNAARAMGLPRLGVIAPGHEADLTLLGHDYEVVATVVGGEVLYQR